MSTNRYDVPTDATVHRCEYCDRPFADEKLLALHRGFEHHDRIGDDELTAFESAYGSETDELRHYQILAIGTLVVLYFGLLIVYALA